MTTRATVRVTSQDGSDAKPDRGRLEAAASKLTERGFQVTRIGRFGVNIEGPEATFAKELGVKVKPQQSLVAPIKPAESGLSDLIDLVEVAGAPTPMAE